MFYSMNSHLTRIGKTSSNELVLRSEIFVQDVIFKYQNTQKSVINKINFKINKGESVGFVGKVVQVRAP